VPPRAGYCPGDPASIRAGLHTLAGDDGLREDRGGTGAPACGPVHPGTDGLDLYRELIARHCEPVAAA
jgi:hypothetical protein